MKLQAAFVLMLFGILVPSCSQLIADHKEGELIPETSEAVMSYAFLAGTDRLSRSEKSAIIDFLARQNLTDRDLLIATIPNPGEPARLEIRSDEIHQLLSRYPARIRFSASARIQGTDPHPVENGILRVSRVHSLKPNCRVDQGELEFRSREHRVPEGIIPA